MACKHECKVGDAVLPGDVVLIPKPEECTDPPTKPKHTVLGPGLRINEENIVVTTAGVLRRRDPAVYWVESRCKRYVATKGDNVIGVVVNKAGDIFRVDIGSSELASLSYIAFEGATKRNRPDVKIGDLLYTKLLVASKDVEPELVCIDGNGRSSGLGVVPEGGYIIKTTTSLARKILTKNCILLKSLGKPLPYEIIVGLNGWIWVKGRSIQETLDLANAVSSVEYMDNDQIKLMVKQLSNSLVGVK